MWLKARWRRQEKHRIRKLMLQTLTDMPDDMKYEQQLNLYRGFWKESCYQIAQTIGFYLSTDENLVNTRALINQAFSDKKKCYVPYTNHGRRPCMVFVRLRSHNQMERWPDQEEPVSIENMEMAPSRLDLLILPGIAFDKRGFCLGNDGHDRYWRKYIIKHPPKFTMGLAFDCQILSSLPVEKNDVPIKLILWT